MPKSRHRTAPSSVKGNKTSDNAGLVVGATPGSSPAGPPTPPLDDEAGRSSTTTPILRRSRRLNAEVAVVVSPELPRPTPEMRRTSVKKRKASDELRTRVSLKNLCPESSPSLAEDLPPIVTAFQQSVSRVINVSVACGNSSSSVEPAADGIAGSNLAQKSFSMDAVGNNHEAAMRLEVRSEASVSVTNLLIDSGSTEVRSESGEAPTRDDRCAVESMVADPTTPENLDGSLPEPSSQATPMAQEEAGPRGRRRRAESRAEASRSRFLQIARDRAFHFAHFDAEGGEAPAGAPSAPASAARQRGRHRRRDAEQPRAQPQEADWPGPFSTARQLVSNRAMAAAARQNAGDASGVTAPVVDWKPTRDPSNWNALRKTPSLQDLCLDVLADNAESVVSLEGVPDLVRVRISAAFCRRRKMTAKALSLFFQGTPSEVHSLDCTQVCEEELVQMMKQLCPGHLEKLHLEHCGRALSEQCLITTIANPSTWTVLKSVCFRGAYRMSDKGLEVLLQAAPHLVNLDLSHCSFLTNASLEAVARCLGDTLECLVLDGCPNLNGLVFVHHIIRMTRLRKLSMVEVGGITDEVVSELCVQLGSNLKELVLAWCHSLTDAAVAAIGSCCFSLESLNLANLPALTDIAIAHITDNLRSLQVLNLRRCKLSDEAIAAYVTASGGSLVNLCLNSVQKVAGQTIMALARHSNACLESLDLSFCRLVDDEYLGFLADSCSKLRELRLFGCTQVTDKFLNGHSNANLYASGLTSSQ